MRYTIKYVDEVSPVVVVEQEFALSFEGAWDRANDHLPELRTKHGRGIHYVIEDMLGTQLVRGPERYGDA